MLGAYVVIKMKTLKLPSSNFLKWTKYDILFFCGANPDIILIVSKIGSQATNWFLGKNIFKSKGLTNKI